MTARCPGCAAVCESAAPWAWDAVPWGGGPDSCGYWPDVLDPYLARVPSCRGGRACPGCAVVCESAAPWLWAWEAVVCPFDGFLGFIDDWCGYYPDVLDPYLERAPRCRVAA